MLFPIRVRADPSTSFSAYEDWLLRTVVKMFSRRVHLCTGVTETLGFMKGSLTVDDKQFKLKAQIPTEVGSIRMRVQVFAHPSRPGTCVCEFRRMQGDSLHHRRLFDQAMGMLSDIVLFTEDPALASASKQASAAVVEQKEQVAAVTDDAPQ